LAGNFVKSKAIIMKTFTTTVLSLALLASTTVGVAQPSQANTMLNLKKAETMKNQSFTTTVAVSQSPAQVFDAITSPKAWWSEEIEGNTSEPNDEFLHHYKDVHICKLKLTEVVPNKKIVWHVLDNHFNFISDQREWVGTDIIFEISEKDGKTQLHFTHDGLVPQYECFEVCEDAWTSYIQGSLKSLIETGKGMPNPKEGGLNAELVERWNLPNK
jgi:hypothetical protein